MILIYKNNTSSVNCKQRSLIKNENCGRNVKLLKAHLDELKQQSLVNWLKASEMAVGSCFNEPHGDLPEITEWRQNFFSYGLYPFVWGHPSKRSSIENFSVIVLKRTDVFSAAGPNSKYPVRIYGCS